MKKIIEEKTYDYNFSNCCHAKCALIQPLGNVCSNCNKLFEPKITIKEIEIEQPETFKCLCPYCNAPYDALMLEKLDLSEASYTPGCKSNQIYGTIDIICSNCKKLVYRKEIETGTSKEWDPREDDYSIN